MQMERVGACFIFMELTWSIAYRHVADFMNIGIEPLAVCLRLHRLSHVRQIIGHILLPSDLQDELGYVGLSFSRVWMGNWM